MKVILLRDIARLGQRGEIKEVAEGYAINVLVKKGDALMATPAELAKWKQKEEAKIHKKELATNTFTQLVTMLHQNPIVITNKKADAKGQLFASIKEADIVDAIFEITKMSIDSKQVHIPTVIKSLGKHPITLQQGTQKESLQIEVK